MRYERARRQVRMVLMSLMVLIAASGTSRAQTLDLTVESNKVGVASGDVFAVTLKAAAPTDVVLRVYDSQARYVRSLKAGYFKDQPLVMPWNMKDDIGNPAPAGDFTLRAQAGLSLTLDKSFAKDGVLASDDFVSPSRVCVDAAGALYVFDAGAQIIRKFNPDGSAATGEGSVLTNATQGQKWTDFAVLPDDGWIIVTVGHGAQVFDAKSGKPLHYVGGFPENNEAWEWKSHKGGIGWPSGVAAGGNHRVYMMSPGYLMLAAFDARKTGFDAGVWMAGRGGAGESMRLKQGWYSPGSGTTDGRSTLYMASASIHSRAQIVKIIDRGEQGDGEWCIDKYTDPRSGQAVAMGDIYAVANDRQGLIFATVRGKSRIDAFIDCGSEPAYLNSFGIFGSDAAKLEFTCPSSAVVSPDGKLLYVSEDGEQISKENSAIGLARVTRYTIGFAQQAEVTLTVTP